MKKILLTLCLASAPLLAFEKPKPVVNLQAPAEKPGKPREGAIMDCTHGKDGKFSKECETRREEVRSQFTARRGDLMEACREDVEKLCKGIEHGEGRLVKCLRDHKKQLSAPCQDAFKDMRKDFKKR